MSVVALLVPGLIAAILCYRLTPLAGRLALRIGAVDHPGPRKIHQQAMPRLGGLAVVAAVAAVALGAWTLFPESLAALPQGLLIGAALGLLPVLAVSIADDIKPRGVAIKLCGHVTGALIAVAFGVSLGDTVHIFGQPIALGAAAVPLSVLWIVGLTNAFNLVDGLDGLSAGLGLIATSSLAAVFVVVHQPEMAATALVLAGALCGFLPYNLYPARLFLGDAGASAIGFCLAAFALRGGSTLSAGMATLLPVFVLGLPIADTTISVVRRLITALGSHGPAAVFTADGNHIHHRLLALGMNQARAVRMLYGVGVVLGGAGLLSLFMSARESALLVLALLLAGFVGLGRLGYDEFAIIRRGVVLRFYDIPVLKRSTFIVFADVLMVAVSALLGVALKAGVWDLAGHRQAVLQLVVVFAPVTVIMFWVTGLYRGMWRVANVEDFGRVCGGVVATTVVAAVGGTVLQAHTVPMATYVIVGLLLLAMMNGSRASFIVLLAGTRRAAEAGVPVIIYGAGRGGVSAGRELLSNLSAGLRPVAFIDDDPRTWHRTINGLPVLGPIGALDAAIRRVAARAVVISTEKVDDALVGTIADTCAAHGIELLEMRVTFNRVRRGSDAVVSHPAWRREYAQAGRPARARRAADQDVPQLVPIGRRT